MVDFLSKVLNVNSKFISKKRFFPYVSVSTVEDYFSLNKKEREKFFIYLKPFSLPCDLFDHGSEKGWRFWSKQIRKEYPIQGWFREFFLSYDNPIYSFFMINCRKLTNFFYSIKRFFNPCSPRFFKSWRRWEYLDKVEAIRIVNFAMIQDFWHDEVNNGFVNWESDTPHKVFYEWIKSAISWIEVERSICENRKDAGYNIASELKDQPYEIRYSEVNKWEDVIKQKDQDILIDMIKYRDFFWT